MDRILLIGVGDSTLSCLSSILDESHFHIVVTHSCIEGLDLLATDNFELVISGISISDMSATDLLKNIRKNFSPDELPVIILYDTPYDKDLSELIQFGATDLICNALPEKVLKIKISNVLHMHRNTAELKRGVKTLQALIDNIPVMTMIVDEDVRVLNANVTSQNFLNKSLSGIFDQLGGNVLNCIQTMKENSTCGREPECQSCIIRNSVSHTFKSGEPIYKLEGKFIVRNNSHPQTLELLISTSQLTYNDKPAVLLSIDDITSYKQALREMKEARDLYAVQAAELSKLTTDLDAVNKNLNREKDLIQAIFDSSNIGITIVDKEGRYLMVNNWFIDQIGYSAEELRTLKNFDITHPDDLASSKLWFSKILNGETERYCLDKKYVRKDGTYFWADLSVSLVRSENEGIAAVIGIVRDITWFKEVTESLIKSEIVLKEAQKIGNIAHWEYDIVNDSLSISEQMYNIFEIDPQSFVVTFTNILGLLDQRAKQRFIDGYSASVKNRTVFNFEDRIVTSSGKTKYIIGKAETRYDHHGNPVFTIGTMSDISDRKEQELKIALQNKELHELNATKDKFFSIISHDLKNTFGTVMGLTEVLASDFDTFKPDELREYLTSIATSSKTTYSLLENLLVWAKSQQGSLIQHPVKAELKSVIAESLDPQKNQIELKDISLHDHVPDNLFVYADTDMLKTVIRNILSNAVKFTPRGGRIDIKASVKKDHVEIRISDNGTGMDERTRESLFRISEAESKRGTEGEPGTGLGLILCKEFITKSNGRIWVESEPGKGSTFYFTVPQAE